MKDKGQMFLLGALVIVTIIIILRYNISLPTTTEQKRMLENRFENEMFKNVIGEFNNTIRFSYDEPLNITSNVFDFANFTEQKISQSSMVFKMLYIGSTANRTTGKMNVTVVNMLDQSITVNLTLNNSVSESYEPELADYASQDLSYNITLGNPYRMSVSYEGFDGNFSVPTRTGKDVYVGFFYISLESENSEHKSIYQKDIVFEV